MSGLRREGGLLEALAARIEELENRVAELEQGAAPTALLTVTGAAERLAIAPSTVRTMIRTGRLPAKRIGRAVRLAIADVDSLAEKRATGGPESPHERAARVDIGGRS